MKKNKIILSLMIVLVSVVVNAQNLVVYTNDGVDIDINADVIPNLDLYYTDTNVGKVIVKHVDIKTNKVLGGA